MNQDVECPYCGGWNEVNHDDGQGYEEDRKHEMECWKCKKSFVFTTSISFYYESDKADCLNDGKHDFKPSLRWPKICTEMKCSMCEEKRQPTVEEWRTILTKEEIEKYKNEYPEAKWLNEL